jgi:membrane protease YdiL (CAAX protease family)
VKREPLVLIFAIVFPTVMAWLYFVELSGGSASADAGPIVRAVYAAGKVIQFGLPFAWLGCVDRSALRWSGLTVRGLGAGAIFGLAVAALAAIVYLGFLAGSPALAAAAEAIRAKLGEFGVATPTRFWMLAIFLSVVNSLLEEVYWRWFVFGRLRRYVSVATAIVVSSLAFMAHHVIVLSVYFPGRFLTAVVPFSLAIAFGGAVWAWMYYRTDSLLGPWLSHVLVDLAVMAIGYDLAFHR